MNVDFAEVLALANQYGPEMNGFLRDLIAIPGESGQEEQVIGRIAEEMRKVGFDQVTLDPMGNVFGYIGHGQHLIAMDAHVDTVGIGNPELWDYDPYTGFEDEVTIGGRGASDQAGGMAAMVYAGRIIKELGLEDDYTLVIVGSVQEEDCDGLCWQYIISEDGLRPEFVVLTEPTNGQIHCGQRGRMEIKVQTSGLSCHGSAPERGDNAIYKIGPILAELCTLNENLPEHPFLGKGSLTVSEIFYTSPSRCAVPDSCHISIDRRLTAGETAQSALQQIKNLPSVRSSQAEVSLYHYDRPSYTGLIYPTEAYFPAWLIEEQHPVSLAVQEAYRQLFGEQPGVGKWTFSTNGVAIMGKYGIPSIGFGPGHEEEAHAPNEKTWKTELVKAAALYAIIPHIYATDYAGMMPNCTANLVR